MGLLLSVGGMLVAGAGVWGLERAIRVSSFAAGVLLLGVLATSLFPVQTVWSLGPFSVHLLDVVAGVLLAAAVARLLRSGQVSTGQLLVAAFGGMVVVSMAIGLTEFAFQPAIREARKFGYFAAAALYFSTVEPRQEILDRIAKLWVGVAGVWLTIAVIRWIALALGVTGGVLHAEGPRVLWAAETFFLLHAFYLSVVAWRGTGSVWWGRFAVALLAAIVLLQHRTVWVALLAGVLVIALRDRVLARRLAVLGVSAVLVGGVFVLAVFGDGGEVTGQLARSAQSEETFVWRYEGWLVLLEGGGVEDATQALVGRPFGSGWDRQFDGQLVSVSPHNFYLEVYLRIGVLGLTLLGALYVLATRRLSRIAGLGGLLSPQALHLILLSHLLYFITYGPSIADGLMLGLGIAFTTGPSQKPRAATPSHKVARR